MLDDGASLFSQIAEQLAGQIIDGTLAEGDQAPSTNQLAAFYRINPATAAKGISVLFDEGLLEKHRGVGMFVSGGARERLLAARRERFASRYVDPMIEEGARLGIPLDALIELVRASGTAQAGVGR